MLKSRNGFSLLEMMIFIVILSIFFIMAASVVTVTLRNMKFNENKIKATHYANQLEEWLRTQKELEWGGRLCNGCTNPNNFTQLVSQQGSLVDDYLTTFCFDLSPIGFWPNPGNCPAFDLDSKFMREVIFTSQVDNNFVVQVNASIVLTWQDLGQDKNIISNTIFTVLEQQ